jgi:hypothetical protein
MAGAMFSARPLGRVQGVESNEEGNKKDHLYPTFQTVHLINAK